MTNLVDRKCLVLAQIAVFLECILLKEEAYVVATLQEVLISGNCLHPCGQMFKEHGVLQKESRMILNLFTCA